MATKIAVAPSLRSSLGLGVERRGRRCPSSARNAALPSSDARGRRPSPSAPLPVGESKSVASPSVELALVRGARRWRRRADARWRARRWRRAAAASASSKPSARHDRDHLRLALGQRAGLVDDQRVDLLHALQRLGVLDQHAGLRAAADADHDRHRRGEAERAGAGDDQHRDGGDQRVGEARLRPEHRPGGEGERPRRRSPPARTSRRPDRRARWIGARERCACATICTMRDSIVSRPTCSARITKPPVWLSVPPITLSPGSLRHRHRLAGDHRFVERGAAFER